jgi:hypothetical protein
VSKSSGSYWGSVAGNDVKGERAWPKLQLSSDTEQARDELCLPSQRPSRQTF